MAITEGPMTLTSLIDEVTDVLHGYVRAQESKTDLTSNLTSTGLTFMVSDSKQVSAGVIQIDDELLYVSSVDPTTGNINVAPWGRAQSQTEAVAHSIGAQVTNNPLFPRQRIRNALWGVLREAFPDVYPVSETLFTVNPVKTNYTMPSDAYHILSVQWQVPGPSGLWSEASRWKQNKRAGDPIELELFTAAWPGANRLRVQYMREPPTQFGASDDLSTYGYDLQSRDLWVLGAAARVMAYIESSRVLLESVANVARAEVTPPGSATNISKYLYQLFQKRIDDERRQQILRHPLQLHRTR